MDGKVLDAKGLVKENYVLVVYFPFENAILPLRVVKRLNAGLEEFYYGPIPYTASGHETGVVPANSTTSEFTFSYARLVPEVAADMWFFTDENKVYHVHVFIEPAYLLRCFVRIPYGTTHYDFRGVTPSEGLAKEIEFGFFRGYKEMVFLPHIKVGWIIANTTNIDLRTYVKFIYGEYETEFVRDPEVIWDIMIKKIPAHWVTFGGKIPIDAGTMQKMLGALNAAIIHMLPMWTPRDQAVEQIRREIEGG